MPYTGVMVQISKDGGKTWQDCLERSQSPVSGNWLKTPNRDGSQCAEHGEVRWTGPDAYLFALQEECAWRTRMKADHPVPEMRHQWRAVKIQLPSHA